ncbi:MAG: hypothetical protein Q7U80_06530 [Thiobacillus sp.]|nr:hypothetical protein [Thiobacillus sp.]
MAGQLKKLSVIAIAAVLTGCIQTEDEKRMDCLEDAANAPTAQGVYLKKSMCLLNYPVKPGQFVNGASNPNDPRITFTKIEKQNQD